MTVPEIAKGPRLTPKGRATRQRIVDAAAQLVAEHGVAGLGIEDVRALAGVSGSQLYHYFDDRQDLIRAVVAHQADAIVDGQRPLLDHLDSFEGLRAWARTAVDRQRAAGCRGGCTFGSLASELAETDDVARGDLANGFRRWEGLLHQGLRTMHERGELRPEADPQQLAFGLLAALQGGLLIAQTLRDPRPLEAALDTMLAQVESFAAVPVA